MATGARAAHVEVAEVSVPVGPTSLTGVLSLPSEPRGAVVFAHGGGSGRASPRNRAVAGTLVRAGYGTLLLDLLTAEEKAEDAETGRYRFDVPLQGERVVGAIDWVDRVVPGQPLGLFGANTGTAAALIAATERPERVRALVSRGGRPELAGDVVEQVRAPVLLIVGSLETDAIRANHAAQARLRRPCRLEIIPGAGQLFEEPGALERVAQLTLRWFTAHLASAP